MNDEVKKVEDMYWQTRAEIDANTLDGYARPRDNTKNGPRTTGYPRPRTAQFEEMVQLGRKLDLAGREARRWKLQLELSALDVVSEEENKGRSVAVEGAKTTGGSKNKTMDVGKEIEEGG